MWIFMNDQALKLKAPLHSNEILLSSSWILKRAWLQFSICLAQTHRAIYLSEASSPFSKHCKPLRGWHVDKNENLNHTVKQWFKLLETLSRKPSDLLPLITPLVKLGRTFLLEEPFQPVPSSKDQRPLFLFHICGPSFLAGLTAWQNEKGR